MPEYALAYLQSTLWPGAVAVAADKGRYVTKGLRPSGTTAATGFVLHGGLVFVSCAGFLSSLTVDHECDKCQLTD